MKTLSQDFDAVVVGAGTAGTAAAYHLALAGLRVALLDARPIEKSGPRWVNAVAPWQFDRAGIGRPEAPECRAPGGPALLRSPGGHTLRLGRSPVWEVDMRLLVLRLQKLAAGAKVKFFERTRVGTLELGARGRPKALHARGTHAGDAESDLHFSAPLFIDASGLSAALRRQAPGLSGRCPDPPPRHLCQAAQFVHHVRDKEEALDFLAREGVAAGEVSTRLGTEGGFSTSNVLVEPSLESVSLLTGPIADGRHESGAQMVRKVLEKEPWIGAAEFGGAGLIPLRRPYDTFTTEGLALLGNAACQVFPAHGSGIGPGLIAAKILAESVGHESDPGSAGALWDYQAAFMREVGPLLAGYDVFRRATQSFSPGDIDALLDGGFLTGPLAAAGIEQQFPAVSLADLPPLAKGLAKFPGLAARFVPRLLQMSAARAIYARYPEKPGERAHSLWARAAGAVFAERPDAG